MSDVQPETAGVQAQYAARVGADLETNRKEQERVGAEVAALQEQLQVLENDHALLLSMQQALGSTSTPAAAAKKTSPVKKAVPAPRASAGNSRGARTKKPTATKPKPKTKDEDKSKGEGKAAKSAPASTEKKPAAPAAGPTLVELIDSHLGQQSEPRSAAEITTALAQARPERTIKTTVVRTTVEGLVAKGRAQRTKQGSSVFYTAAAPEEKSAAPQPETSTG
ncbi:hypothetical protein ACFQ0X_02370 [Streptomyces rectiviolaceus]|uniref:Gamma-butyrolactone-binding regulator SlbR n=1 Tax=Streptomyces rectiviolaceus TaxID=332591 RepID=A0ABP6MDU9_9ACTN